MGIYDFDVFKFEAEALPYLIDIPAVDFIYNFRYLTELETEVLFPPMLWNLLLSGGSKEPNYDPIIIDEPEHRDETLVSVKLLGFIFSRTWKRNTKTSELNQPCCLEDKHQVMQIGSKSSSSKTNIFYINPLSDFHSLLQKLLNYASIRSPPYCLYS